MSVRRNVKFENNEINMFCFFLVSPASQLFKVFAATDTPSDCVLFLFNHFFGRYL